MLQVLGQVEQAEAEFAAAVRLRPDDAGVWLAPSQGLWPGSAESGRQAANLARAQRLEGGEARPWVETGQMLAELGEARRKRMPPPRRTPRWARGS